MADGNLPFDISKPTAFYFHIPFCKQICAFCEYSKVILPSADSQTAYLKTLRNDIFKFIDNNSQIELYGLDIGGGTPTALDDNAFAELINIYVEILGRCAKTNDYEPSIEGTFETLTEKKLHAIVNSGIHRISLGIQSSSESILAPLKRNVLDVDTLRQIMRSAYQVGIQKINIDFMYGLPNQTIESVKKDIYTISILRPEQVTVYELRTNQLWSDYRINNQLCYNQYSILFDELTKLGYFATFGGNTFSTDSADKGLSSYLRHRMFDGWQYKGFGVSAQSMSDFGIAYNIGKNRDRLTCEIKAESFESDQYYALPPQELLAKFIAISGYSGGFSMDAAKRIYGNQFYNHFIAIIETLVQAGLVYIHESRIQLTKKGYQNYGALLSLFYPG